MSILNLGEFFLIFFKSMESIESIDSMDSMESIEPIEDCEYDLLLFLLVLEVLFSIGNDFGEVIAGIPAEYECGVKIGEGDGEGDIIVEILA